MDDLDVRGPALQAPTHCPKCGRRESFVVESRPTKHGVRRRRYRCKACNHRHTTYEISQQDFDAMKKAQAAFVAISKAVLETQATQPSSSIPCFNCIHAINETCGLTIPEAFTTDAIDCSSHASPS